MTKRALLVILSALSVNAEYFNEVKVMEGHTKKKHVMNPLPHT